MPWHLGEGFLLGGPPGCIVLGMEMEEGGREAGVKGDREGAVDRRCRAQPS